MALDTRVMEMPSWLRPRQEWTANDTLQALNMGIEHQQRQQQMALRIRELALREQYQTTLNEKRLADIEEQQAEVDDLPLLYEYSKNPSAGIPNFKSPKSYSKLGMIDLQQSRTELGKQNAADLADFNKRLARVGAKARFSIMEMQRRGAPPAEIWDALNEAEAEIVISQMPIFGPDGQYQGMAVTGKGVKVIPHTSKMSDIDRIKYTAAQKHINDIEKLMRDPFNSRYFNSRPELKADIDASRKEAEDMMAEIESRYSGGPTQRIGGQNVPNPQTPVPEATDPNDPLGLR